MYHVEEAGIDTLDVEQWNDLAQRSEVCDAFQTYELAEVVRNSLNSQPRFLVVRDGTGTVGGVLFFKKRMFGIFDSYEVRGGPLYLKGNKAVVMKSILKAFGKKKTRSMYSLFIPSPLINCGFMEMFKAEGYHPLAFRTLIVDLKKPIEEIWRALNTDARRGVRRANDFGVKVEIANRWPEWEEFYKLHLIHSRNKQYSTYPRNYFKEIFKLHRKNLCRLFIAKYRKQVIAGHLFLICRENMIGLLNASLRTFLKYRPNYLIQWRSIEWARENGVMAYDMNGLPWEATKYLHGIYQYKKRWDGYVQWYYYYLSNEILCGGVHLLRTSFLAWKLFASLKNCGIIQS